MKRVANIIYGCRNISIKVLMSFAMLNRKLHVSNYKLLPVSNCYFMHPNHALRPTYGEC